MTKKKKKVFLPAGKIKCHSSSFAYEIFMKRKTLLFLIFYAKQVPKKSRSVQIELI